MALTAGARLGPYEIVSPLGAGGMGEVYRARDTRLKRDVAVKVLPEAFAADPERLARFQREAELLATLNHPNITAVYGLERADGATAIVLELVEGPTLADLLGTRHPSPERETLRSSARSGETGSARGGGASRGLELNEALGIARQIAEALEAAHEQGIIHRDLKPSNIKLRPDGPVKVLDFGLAKLMEAGAAGRGAGGSGGSGWDVTNSPTITTPAMTQIGVILGTAAYMSPEQAKGRPADKRSDIWAFGCVLYEMLAGRRAFEGEDVSDTLAAVLRGEPDWSALPGEVPPLIRRLLRRCLAKDRSKRLSDAAAARLDIDEAVANPEAPVRNGVPPQQRRRERIMWIGMASLAVVTAAAIAVAARASRIALPAPEMRVDIVTPPSTAPGWVALSPDGKKIAFVVRMDGEDTLWLRSLEDGSTRALAGTEGATAPFWSPDSRSIAFGGRPGLRRLDLADGSIRTLAYGYGADGGTWNRQGVIVFAPTSVSPLVRLSADTGGTPVPVTHVKAGEVGHVRPQFLADGEHLVYDVRSAAPNVGGIYVTSLDGAEPKRLVSADSALVVSDHLVFARQGELFAQPFDGSRLELVGEPFRVASLQPVRAPSRDVPTPLSASSVGSIAFRVATGVDEPQLRWFDRQGKEIGRIDVPGGDFGNPDLSPDERRLAVRRLVNGNADIWTFDLVRGVWARTTSDAEAEGQPVWSPDGSRIAYFSARQGSANFYVRQASGAGAEELLLATTRIKKIEGWSPDGRYIVYSSPSETNTSGQDLWLLPLVGDRKPSAIVQNGFSVRNGQFSPDGRWIAYESNESGRYEIYAQPFPGPGERVQISTTGGAQARWRRDGRELFYIAIDDGLMAVPLRYSAGGRAIDVGAAVHLFATRIRGGAIQGGGNKQQYVVSGDGQRFLINTAVDDVVSPITLILNWKRSR